MGYALRVLLGRKPVRDFLDVNGTVSGAFSRLTHTKLPFTVSKDDLLASHQYPSALKIYVSQGCGSSLQHHVSNTEGVCTAAFWCNREMSELQAVLSSLKLDHLLLATPNISGLRFHLCWCLLFHRIHWCAVVWCFVKASACICFQNSYYL